jgi:hypothetical protein
MLALAQVAVLPEQVLVQLEQVLVPLACAELI